MPRYDVLIRNTTVIDGTGKPGREASVGILGGKIAAVGKIAGHAARVIDGSGMVTCPGFVDPHSHADLTILQFPLAENLVMQGITTFLGSHCGMCPAPVGEAEATQRLMSAFGADVDVCWKSFGEWLDEVGRTGISVNFAPMAGHNAIRTAVMGKDLLRKARPAEIRQMKAHVDEAMRAGAFGLSGTFDPPDPPECASPGEVIELLKVTRHYGGLYSPHTRHHQSTWWTDDPNEAAYGLYHGRKGDVITGRYHGLLEALEIARLAGKIRLLIAHFTPAFLIPQPHPLYLQEAVARASLEAIIDKAVAEGIDTYFNVIPIMQSLGHEKPILDDVFSPHLAQPEWLRPLSRAEFAAKLKEREFRDLVARHILSGRFKFGMMNPVADPYWSDCVQVVRTTSKQFEGRTIGELARQRQPDHIVDAVFHEALEVMFDLIAADPNVTWAVILDKREYPGATPIFLKHPLGMPCSDVRALPAIQPPNYVHNVPIAYGVFAHYFQTFVREMAVLTWEEAVYHATYLPAQKVLGLKDRGVIASGAAADIVVMNPTTIRMSGTFRDPTRPPEGIEHVLVNGQIVYSGKQHTGARPGKVLRRG